MFRNVFPFLAQYLRHSALLRFSPHSTYSISSAVEHIVAKNTKAVKVASVKKLTDSKALVKLGSSSKKTSSIKKEHGIKNNVILVPLQATSEKKVIITTAKNVPLNTERTFEIKSSLEEFNSAFGIATPNGDILQIKLPKSEHKTDTTADVDIDEDVSLSSKISDSSIDKHTQFTKASSIPKSISRFFPALKKVPKPKSKPTPLISSKDEASLTISDLVKSKTESNVDTEITMPKQPHLIASYNGITPNSMKNGEVSSLNFFTNQLNKNSNSSYSHGGLISIVPKDQTNPNQNLPSSPVKAIFVNTSPFISMENMVTEEGSLEVEVAKIKEPEDSIVLSIEASKLNIASSSSFEKSEASIIKNLAFSSPASQTSVISLLHLYDCQLNYNPTREMKIDVFLKMLRLLFYLYKPTVFSTSTIFNISKLKCIADEAAHWKDISMVFPLEKMLPSLKSFQESRITFPIEIHIAVMSILDKIKAKLFAYEYYLEFLMKDPISCTNPILLKNVIKALSSHQFASKSVFDHFLRNGGIPTPDVVVDLLASPNLIDSAYLYESYFDQYIKIPYLEQKVFPGGEVKIEDNQLLQATKSMLGLYARGATSYPLYNQNKISTLKDWIKKYAPSVASNPDFHIACKIVFKKKSQGDPTLVLD